MPTSFVERTIDELEIDDEESFGHVALYAQLKEVLRRADYKFRVLPEGPSARWDRALLLNLTFWGANAGGDVLVDDHLAADVVGHVAWHHLAAAAFAERGATMSTDALFMGEAIASAFDVYLVGRLLGHAPRSSFLETQVPSMAEAAEAAGLSRVEFAALLEGIVRDPERAFEDLRELLFDATHTLLSCRGVDDALAALAVFDGHRFGPLLHRYELSNWVLDARAHPAALRGPDALVRRVDRTLREEKVALDWLTSAWVSPASPSVPSGS